MRVPFFESHWRRDEAAASALADVLASGCYIGGDQVEAFESEFAAWLAEGRTVVGVNSGTDALYAALRILGIGRGDEVLMPSFTFIACLEAVLRADATPVLVDCAPGSFLPGLRQIEAALTASSRAVLAVPLFGETSGIAELQVLCRERGLLLIEDVAQACGGLVPAGASARRAGTLGDAAAFSFYPTKVLGAAGDGGAVAFRDPDHAARARALRNHGLRAGAHGELGINSRLDAVQAALLRIGLRNLDVALKRRHDIAMQYLDGMSNLPMLELPTPHIGHAWNYFVVRHPSREQLQQRLTDSGIDTRVYYQRPIHREPAFRALFPERHLPHCEQLSQEALALPLFPAMTSDQTGYVIDVVRRACHELRTGR